MLPPQEEITPNLLEDSQIISIPSCPVIPTLLVLTLPRCADTASSHSNIESYLDSDLTTKVESHPSEHLTFHPLKPPYTSETSLHL